MTFKIRDTVTKLNSNSTSCSNDIISQLHVLTGCQEHLITHADCTRDDQTQTKSGKNVSIVGLNCIAAKQNIKVSH
jgi:hypothetical protein